jgi:hypothetical protein
VSRRTTILTMAGIAITAPAAACAAVPTLTQVIVTPSGAAVAACGSVVAALVAQVAHRRDLAATAEHVDVRLDRLAWNARFAHPWSGHETPAEIPAPPARTIPGEIVGQGPDARPICPGQLETHQDGTSTCSGGLDDCWPGIGPAYAHRRAAVSCGNLSHGCGVCAVTGSHR